MESPCCKGSDVQLFSESCSRFHKPCRYVGEHGPYQTLKGWSILHDQVLVLDGNVVRTQADVIVGGLRGLGGEEGLDLYVRGGCVLILILQRVRGAQLEQPAQKLHAEVLCRKRLDNILLARKDRTTSG